MAISPAFLKELPIKVNQIKKLALLQIKKIDICASEGVRVSHTSNK